MIGIFVFLASVLTLVFIYATLATILNFEAGWGGLWDLGTAGLLAVGAYCYVILTVESNEIIFSPQLPVWAGIVVTSIFTGAVAFLIGLPSLRMRDEYFLITTFAFSVVVLQLITTESSITLGATGFHNIQRPFDDYVSTRSYNFVLLGISTFVLITIWLLIRRLGRSPFGRLLRAIRDNEPAAKSIGKMIFVTRLKVFVITGALIGAISPMYVWYIRSLSPHMFHVTLAFTVWTALVIGGIGNFWGPVVGALILIGLTEALQFLQYSAEYAVLLSAARPIIIGVGLIIVMRFRPEGISPEKHSFKNARKIIDYQKQI
jgi:branched-chain amino acid transport system permease protein